MLQIVTERGTAFLICSSSSAKTSLYLLGVDCGGAPAEHQAQAFQTPPPFVPFSIPAALAERSRVKRARPATLLDRTLA